jgi:hypothetical protein
MSLFVATLLVGLVLLALGMSLYTAPGHTRKVAVGMLRSQPAAFVFLGIATAWFCWEIWHLGEPDFGNHKQKLFWGFILISGLSFFYVPDFLAVRGLAALLLLCSDAVLDAAYMEAPQSRLFLVSFTYLVIVGCMYLASLPYRLRDFLTWLFAKAWRPRFLAVALSAYGLLLIGITFTY